MPAEVISLLSKLEPALGISFALNLAYIGLPRFRYREAIKGHVRRKNDEMQNFPEHTCSTLWFKQIKRLGDLENNDGESAPPAEVGLPSEIWAKLYSCLFERHTDRRLIVGAAMFCGTMLFLGVAHELEFFTFTQRAFSTDYIGIWLAMTALAAVWPVFTVLIGNYVVKRAKSFVDSNIKELKKTSQLEAQQVNVDVQAISPRIADALVTRANVIPARPSRGGRRPLDENK